MSFCETPVLVGPVDRGDDSGGDVEGGKSKREELDVIAHCLVFGGSEEGYRDRRGLPDNENDYFYVTVSYLNTMCLGAVMICTCVRATSRQSRCQPKTGS